jgi:putative transposase
MKRSRFTEEQVIGILKEQESGQRTADVCRRHGVSEGTFYKWKAKYGGLEVSEAKRLKALVADTSLSGNRVARELDALIWQCGANPRPSSATMAPSSPARRSCVGARTGPLIGTTSRRVNQCRTALWKASTGGFETNA